MIEDRYNIFKKKYENKNTIYIDCDTINEFRELMGYLKISRNNYKQKETNDVERVLRTMPIDTMHQRYTIVIEPRYNDYYVNIYGITSIENSRTSVLSFTREKITALRIIGSYIPSYKPKRIIRTV